MKKLSTSKIYKIYNDYYSDLSKEFEKAQKDALIFGSSMIEIKSDGSFKCIRKKKTRKRTSRRI